MQLLHQHTRIIPIALGVLLLAVAGLFAFNAIFANAQDNPTIMSAIQDVHDATTTSATIGATVYDKVVVATSTGTVSGTVDFNLYPNTTCSGTSTTQTGIALINGIATSSTTTVPATGLSYKVHYNGQTGVYPPLDGECEPLSARGANATISTTLSTTTTEAGNFAYDSGTLTGVTTNASGTVAYSAYSNGSCTLDKRDAGTKTVASGSVPNSDSLQFNVPGTYYWQAVYSGDSQNAAATSSCGSEILHVLATSTPKGHIVVDKVTIPSGDSTLFHFNTGGSGYAAFNLSDGSTPNDQELSVGAYSITESFMAGWSLTSARCSLNGATSTLYTPGSNISLGSGDTVSCTFTNTKATTTPPVNHHCDGDDDEDDEGCEATTTPHVCPKFSDGFPFGSIPHGFPFTHESFKEFFKNFGLGVHDCGWHLGQWKNGNNGSNGKHGENGHQGASTTHARDGASLEVRFKMHGVEREDD